jgi:hypothetical protein
VSLTINDDRLVLAHKEYQQNIADAKTVGPVINRMKTNIGKAPDVLAGDPGFDQSYKKQQNCRRRWGI